MIDEWTFSPKRAEHFKQWLNLSHSDLKWNQQQKDDFNEFWEVFFTPPMQLKQIHLKFYQLEQSIKTGTLKQWVRWLRDRFNCYLFIFESINLRDLALDSYYRINDLAYILRDFLVHEYPDKKNEIDQYLNIGNYLSENLYISFDSLQKRINLSNHEKCSNKNNMMATLEIPFFEEFNKVLNDLKEQDKDWKEKSLFKSFFYFNMRTAKFIVLFVAIGALVVWGVRSLRQWNDWYLTEKIRVSVPSFYTEDQLDGNKRLPVNVVTSLGLSNELEAEEVYLTTPLEEERESPESDLVISSLEDIPLPLKTAAYESSDYEESKKAKGGFRDYKYGRSRAYRLMINSVHPNELIEKIGDRLETVEFKQVDNVVPGQEIPGGNYYNLYVSNDDISDFLKTFEKEDANLFVSRTPVPNPSGMSRLFIWIKRI